MPSKCRRPWSSLREVGRHPVDDHADAVLVAVIDEVHEVLRRAVAAGGGVVADRLVAPAAGERVLADRQQLDVRVAHLLAVLDELRGQLAVAQPAARVARIAPPTAEVHFVDRHRRVERVVLAAAWRSTRRRSTGSVSRSVTMLAVRGGTSAAKPYGIALLDDVPAAVLDRELVVRALADAGDEQFPHAAGDVLAHRVAAAIPDVEVADDADALGVRRPDGEVHAGDAVDRAQVRAEPLVAPPMRAFAEQVQVVVGQQRGKA